MTRDYQKIEYILFSFTSTADATSALSRVSDLERARLIPTPPEISAGCGYTLRVSFDDRDEAILRLENNPYDRIYTFYHEGKERIINEYIPG